jgi:hypothetical protein
LSGAIRLPGSMAENHQGNPIKEIRQSTWGDRWTNVPVWHPMIKMDYRGAAWYQTTLHVPKNGPDQCYELFLERVCWRSEAWVDGSALGVRDSLSAPHRYDIGPLLPGEHRLTIRVDNREIYQLGCNTHAYHEQSCTIYNGVIGRIELRSHPMLFVRNCQVHADPTTGLCELRVSLFNATGHAWESSLVAEIRGEGGGKSLASSRRKLDALPSGESAVVLKAQVPPAAVEPWSEFACRLYQARITLQSPTGSDTFETRFGFRRYAAQGAKFTINGRPVLLRGEANNAQFPLTGHPPMDKAAWLKMLRLLKDFGLNHVRFHTWVPPDAAFDAADELGIYLQPELPNGEDSIVRDAARGVPWRQAELLRILDTYGNHPSFVQMAMGNEAKTPHIEALKALVQQGREHDPRHLYACISNPEASGICDEVPGDDFAVAHGSRNGRRRMEANFNRAPPETLGDYRVTLEGRPVPQISHETGQWYVYPDLSEIERYTGVLRPVTLDYFRDSAAREGVLGQVPEFVRATGRLSLLLYKEEVERSLRTPGYGGFQLLGVQDSFDQGAAYVGQVNSFFEPKPYLTAAEFREFCGPQTPLARMKKRVWTNDETFTAQIEAANYGPAPLRQATVAWRLMDADHAVARGQFGPLDLPDTGLTAIGQVQCPLGDVSTAVRLQLVVEVTPQQTEARRSARNRWNIWVYPKVVDIAVPTNVKVVNELDAATRRALENGARVVLLPSSFKSDYPTAMTPPFWSPIMFDNQRQILGVLCDPRHPALRAFPTDDHGDWQWFELLFQGAAIHLTDVPAAYRPIVQGIDRPDRNHKLALIYEAKVGRGSLLVSTLDLNRDLDARPVARQLRHCLLQYAASSDFRPADVLPLERNMPHGGRESVLARLSPKATADSEHENHGAVYAVDNNPATIWHTRWDAGATPLPHRLTVELTKPLDIQGFIQIPRADCDHGRIAQYRFLISDDGRAWREIAAGTWPNSDQPQRVELPKPVRARFLQLEAVREVQGRPWTSVAEFDVILAK